MKPERIRAHGASLEHDFAELRKLVRECKMMMAKSDRAVYGDDLIRHLSEASMWFILSYEAKDPALKYRAALRSNGWFAVFREDMRRCVEDNIVKFPHRRMRFDQSGQPIGDPDVERVSGKKLAVVTLVAKIDDGIGRWCGSLSQGQAGVRRADGEDTAADIC